MEINRKIFSTTSRFHTLTLHSVTRPLERSIIHPRARRLIQNGSEHAGSSGGELFEDGSVSPYTNKRNGGPYLLFNRQDCWCIRLSLDTHAKLLTSLINVRRVYVSRICERRQQQFPCRPFDDAALTIGSRTSK